MESTNLRTTADWRASGLRYHPYNHFLRAKFGCRVQKVSVDAGFTCPNVDGTVAVGGCTFCDNRSFSPSRRLPRTPLTGQIDEGIRRLRRRYEDCTSFIAYFQPATNTYAPVEKLRRVYEEALAHPQVVGLAIGTRPDCLSDEALAYLAELSRRTYVSLELGMQSMHDRSLAAMNRAQTHAQMIDAVARARAHEIELCAHLILGWPGESQADMLASAREVARLGLDGVKIHNLYVVRETPLAAAYARGEFTLFDRAAYVRTLVDVLEVLPPRVVVERISGDAPADYFVGPAWCLDKPGLLLALADEFAIRDTWQGKQFAP